MNSTQGQREHPRTMDTWRDAGTWQNGDKFWWRERWDVVPVTQIGAQSSTGQIVKSIRNLYIAVKINSSYANFSLTKLTQVLIGGHRCTNVEDLRT
jgi:hypothetical protein